MVCVVLVLCAAVNTPKGAQLNNHAHTHPVIPAQVSRATTFIVPQFILGSCVMLYVPQMMISQHLNI